MQHRQTLFFSKDKNKEHTEYFAETNIYSSLNSPLNLHLIFRDEYFNNINDNKVIKVQNAFCVEMVWKI